MEPENWDGKPDYDDNDECPSCGGEGFLYSCLDGQCVEAEYGCDECERPCPICNKALILPTFTFTPTPPKGEA